MKYLTYKTRFHVTDEVTVYHIFIIGTNSPVPEASSIFQCITDTLSQCLNDPVKVSQHLYSEKCICEATLDKMESLKGAIDEKTTLLSSILTAMSSDYKKLKVLATVLSKFEETKTLSERIISKYGKKLTYY